MKVSDNASRDRAGDRWVLILIGGGIILTVNFIVFVIWRASISDKVLPSMAEVVFGAIIGGSLVKLADVLSALVTLATGRQIEKQSDQLANSKPPPKPLPASDGQGVAGAAAEDVARTAEERAEEIQDAERHQRREEAS